MSIEPGPSARVIARMLAVLFPDAKSVLDTTWGKGNFWSPKYPTGATVTGLDRDPERARDLVGDFRDLKDIANNSYDVCVFDPPFLTDVSKTNPGVMGTRFASFETEAELIDAVTRGCAEAWRVARLGIIVKVQNHVHQSRSVRMTRWVEDVLPVPAYGEVHTVRTSGKIRSPKWGTQLSVYSNHASYLAFRHGDQRHVRRGSQKLERRVS